jgi:hypothetical protein
MVYKPMVTIIVGQGCIVKSGSSSVATSVREISPGKMFFSVQPHPNFPGLEKLRFVTDKVALGTKPINYLRHYAYSKTGSFDPTCWVSFS